MKIPSLSLLKFLEDNGFGKTVIFSQKASDA